MKPEDKELLQKDLCAKLPYGIIIGDKNGNRIKLSPLHCPGIWVDDNWKPYLRAMEDMTEEEKEELVKNHIKLVFKTNDDWSDVAVDIDGFDWLNAHHLDYRGLIPKGLAIKVTKENNPYKY